MNNISAIIVFTDLDGTLLDHQTYSYDAALPAIDKLHDRGIPLVLASSKTAAEMIPLRRALGFSHCAAIVENGAGTLDPYGDADSHEDQYADLRSAIVQVKSDLKKLFIGFGDMSAEDVANETGLEIEAARLAKQRSFSEPGLWHGDDAQLEEFLLRLKNSGIAAKRGGRFLTLSFGGNKAEQMLNIAQQYQEQFGIRHRTIALGDAPNDIQMLEAADHGVIVLNKSHKGIPALKGEENGQIVRTSIEGPAGWNQAVLELLDK